MTPYQKLLLVRILRLLTKLLMTFKLGNPGCPCCSSSSSSSSLSSSYSSSNPSSSLSSSDSSSESASLSSSSESLSESISESISSSSSEDVDCFCGEKLTGQAYIKFVVSGGLFKSQDSSYPQKLNCQGVYVGDDPNFKYNRTDIEGWENTSGTYLVKLSSDNCDQAPRMLPNWNLTRIKMADVTFRYYRDGVLICEESSSDPDPYFGRPRPLEIVMNDPNVGGAGSFYVTGSQGWPAPNGRGSLPLPTCDPENPWIDLSDTRDLIVSGYGRQDIHIEASYVIL